MPNQREIAAALGVTQATVSLALRGSKLISPDVRRQVCEAAEQMGYRPNAYVNAVMCRIRSGKKMHDKGAIGLLVSARSQQEWYEIESYRIFHQGVVKRSAELGYHIETFFLQEPGMSGPKIDRILQARGINGIILAPPYHGNRELDIRWERYAAIGVGFGWDDQDLNRVGYDSLQSFITAFHELQKLGYRRIGTVLSDELVYGNRRGVKWYTGYLDCRNDLPEDSRIPVFINRTHPPGVKFSEEEERQRVEEFRLWFLKWRPDAVLTIVGEEERWLESMGVRIPHDVGLACLAKSFNDRIAGIAEKSQVVGATAISMVAAQIAHNEFGLPEHPLVTMVEGQWLNGATLRDKSRGG